MYKVGKSAAISQVYNEIFGVFVRFVELHSLSSRRGLGQMERCVNEVISCALERLRQMTCEDVRLYPAAGIRRWNQDMHGLVLTRRGTKFDLGSMGRDMPVFCGGVGALKFNLYEVHVCKKLYLYL